MSAVHLIRVFISSPGDVNEERKIALEVIERLPNRPAFREKVAFRVIAWEKPGAGTTLRASLTPQEAIIRGLPSPGECDIVIVIFWSRLGTPFTYEGRRYLSGTHWELLDALASDFSQTVIYRRDEKQLFAPDDEEGPRQYRLVDEFFKSELFYAPGSGEIRRGVNHYLAPDDFRQQFESHFEELVVEILQRSRLPLFDPAAGPGRDGENVQTIVARRWSGSPFPGLRAFTEADAPIFFGRGRETDALVALLRERRAVAVIGASGSGKSSLVAAGLLPRLRANAVSGREVASKDWLVARFTPGQAGDPFAALAQALVESVPALAPGDPLEFPERLDKLAASLRSQPDYLAKILTYALKDEVPWVEVLLFVDQFEELFTLGPGADISPFIAMLVSAAASPRLRAVITLRADFYHHVADHPDLAGLFNASTLTLSRPKRDALRDMIELPAEQAGLKFEAGLVQAILDDTGDEPGNLALMAFTLDELYRLAEARQERGEVERLSFSDYRSLGGVHGSIGTRAENLFRSLPGAEEAKTAALERVFRRLVTVDDAGRAARQRALFEQVAGAAQDEALVRAFVAARLFTSARDAENRPVVELAHEALLRRDGWPRLADWIETELDDLRLLRRLEAAAQEWAERGRDQAYLWPHERLEPVYRMLARLQVDLAPAAREFIRPEWERLLPAFTAPETDEFERRSVANRLVEIGPATLPALLAGLRARDGGARSIAAQALVRLGTPATPGLLAALQEPEPEVRLSAATALRAIGDPAALPGLQAALRDPDLRIRSVAAGALEALGSEVAAGALLEALEDSQVDVRWRAAGALGAFGEAGIRGLLVAMNDDDPQVRTRAENAMRVVIDSAAPGALRVLRDPTEPLRLRLTAAEALGLARRASAIAGLIETLAGADLEARRLAAGALGAIRDQTAVPVLLSALSDPDDALRIAALEALAAIGDASAAPGLIRLLEDPNLDVRWTAATALGALGAEAIPVLSELLVDERAGLYARCTVAEALSRLAVPGATAALLEAYASLQRSNRGWIVTDALHAGRATTLPALLETLRDPRQPVSQRAAAAEALGVLGDPDALLDLLNALQSPAAALRAAAAGALGALGDPRPAAVLQTALADAHPHVRAAAAGALGDLKAASAVPDLLAALRDQDPDVGDAAMAALVALGQVSIAGLLAALRDPGEAVRARATRALIGLGASAVPGLLSVLPDPDQEVRNRAALALSEIRTLEALFGLAQFQYENGDSEAGEVTSSY